MLSKILQKFRNLKIQRRENKILKLWEYKKYDKLIKLFPNINQYNQFKINQFTFIYFLINQNDKDAITALLTKIQYKDQLLDDDNNPMLVNPISFAFLDGKYDIVQLIQKYGGNINKLNKSAQNILHLAAIYKRQQAFIKGVTRNLNINFPDQFGNTPFHYAARAGIPEMVRTMLAAKAKKQQNKLYQYPIHMAIESKNQQTFQLLKNDVNCSYPKYHPIHSASRSGSIHMIKNILQLKPASLNFKDYKGLTPLHHAILLQNIHVVKSLLNQSGILINDQDQFGNTPLHLAMMNQNLQLCQILLQWKANLDIVNQDGLSPVDYGITSNNKAIHSLLFKYQNKSQKVDEWVKSKTT